MRVIKSDFKFWMFDVKWLMRGIATVTHLVLVLVIVVEGGC
jgi:hypothetical protein